MHATVHSGYHMTIIDVIQKNEIQRQHIMIDPVDITPQFFFETKYKTLTISIG